MILPGDKVLVSEGTQPAGSGLMGLLTISAAATMAPWSIAPNALARKLMRIRRERGRCTTYLVSLAGRMSAFDYLVNTVNYYRAAKTKIAKCKLIGDHVTAPPYVL